MSEPEYLTTREVAALLRVKERKVYELASAGEIPCRRVTGKLLFPRQRIEAWLGGEVEAGEPSARPRERPLVLVGSHDPLLDWALRESGSGVAAFFDGSLDGLERLARGDAIAAGLHIYEPQRDDWNLGRVEQAVGDQPFVLLAWARRRQGLILTPELAGHLEGVADLAGHRVVLRQPAAGGRILFDHLLAAAGVSPERLTVVAAPARTESDAAAAVAGGKAEAALGLETMARQFRLGFLPLVEERYDLLVWRRAYFEPPFQALLRFCGSEAFLAHAREIGGYDVSGLGTVRWNGP